MPPVQPPVVGTDSSSNDGKCDFIRQIVHEVVDQCNLVATNYQCGECGNTFESEAETDDHMKYEHSVTYCQMCVKRAEKEDVIRAQIKDKDMAIAALDEKNINLVRKNESLAKDNRRLNIAFKESIIEKNEAKKEIETQREPMSEILKQNTLLNKEIRVKAEYIKLIDELRKNESRDQDSQQNQKQHGEQDVAESIETIEDDIIEIHSNANNKNYAEVVNTGDEKHKCTQCNYETKVKTHLRGHNIAHHKGQYKCMRGCKAFFKTVGGLDEHLKSKHRVSQKI
jgi:hypothetical protein